MIGQIITLLQADAWHGVSENIEIAKGKHQTPQTFKQGITKIRRKWLSSRKYK
jgi:hypothetical protein